MKITSSNSIELLNTSVSFKAISSGKMEKEFHKLSLKMMDDFIKTGNIEKTGDITTNQIKSIFNKGIQRVKKTYDEKLSKIYDYIYDNGVINRKGEFSGKQVAPKKITISDGEDMVPISVVADHIVVNGGKNLYSLTGETIIVKNGAKVKQAKATSKLSLFKKAHVQEGYVTSKDGGLHVSDSKLNVGSVMGSTAVSNGGKVSNLKTTGSLIVGGKGSSVTAEEAQSIIVSDGAFVKVEETNNAIVNGEGSTLIARIINNIATFSKGAGGFVTEAKHLNAMGKGTNVQAGIVTGRATASKGASITAKQINKKNIMDNISKIQTLN